MSSGAEISISQLRRHDAAFLLLRLLLAWTFIWSGATKVFLWHDFTGARAEVLAELGAVPESELDWTKERFTQPYFDWKSHTPKYLQNEPRTPVARARNVHHLTVMIHGAARPATAPDVLAFNRHSCELGIAAAKASEGTRSWLFPFMVSMAPTLAWMISLVQLLGGVALLVGLASRTAGLGICLVMLGAAWMTQIGPVALGGAPGFLGFLPPHEGWHPHGWKTLLWQASLAAAGASMALTGPGRVSLDNVLAQLRRSGRSGADASL